MATLPKAYRRLYEQMALRLGIDVSKLEVEACLLGDRSDKKPPRRTLGNKADCYALLVNWAEELAGGLEVRYCMESTGGYELGLACYLASTKRHVSVENPRRIKRFADAMGESNKTDRSDARVIAAYALAMDPRPWVLSDENRRLGLQLTRHRENLLTQLGQVRNRLEHKEALASFVKSQLLEQEHFLMDQIKTTDEAMEATVQQCPMLRGEVQVLTGFAGVGTLTAITLLSEMPDVRQFEQAEQWAAQAGMFPARRESGKWRGQTRMCKAGNAHVRRILYMGATKAMSMHPGIKAHAERLKAKGKKPKQVRVACMRKLLLMCFGALKAFYEGKTVFYGLPPQKLAAST